MTNWSRDEAWAALHYPQTPPAVLAQIAGEFPEFAAHAAAHPNAYPELVAWAQKVGEPESADAARLRRRKIIKVASITGAIVVPVVTVLTMVIPVVADWNARSTSIDTLGTDDQGSLSELAVDPSGLPTSDPVAAPVYDGGGFMHVQRMEWDGGTVPADAPFETFPAGSGVEGCTPEQHAWLLEWGVPLEYAVVGNQFRNDATTGASLSLRNLRAEGEFVEPEVPRVSVWCATGGKGDVAPPIWTGLTLGDPAPALFIENPDAAYYDSSQVLPPDLIGTPFVQNLAPGEYAQVYLVLETLDETKDFVGRVVVDVVVNGAVYESVVKEGRIQTGPPGVESLSVLVSGGVAHCLPDLSASTLAFEYVDAATMTDLQCSAPDLATRAQAAASTP